MRIFTLSSMLMVLLTGHAHAHVGHLGELAGHAHWVGIGAIVVAGAIAAALASDIKNSDENEADEENEPIEEPA